MVVTICVAMLPTAARSAQVAQVSGFSAPKHPFRRILTGFSQFQD